MPLPGASLPEGSLHVPAWSGHTVLTQPSQAFLEVKYCLVFLLAQGSMHFLVLFLRVLTHLLNTSKLFQAIKELFS